MKKDPEAEAAKLAKMKDPDWRLYSGWPPETKAVEPEKRKPGRPRKEAPVEEVTPDGDSDAN
jgi:hypothetical protein